MLCTLEQNPEPVQNQPEDDRSSAGSFRGRGLTITHTPIHPQLLRLRLVTLGYG